MLIHGFLSDLGDETRLNSHILLQWDVHNVHVAGESLRKYYFTSDSVNEGHYLEHHIQLLRCDFDRVSWGLYTCGFIYQSRESTIQPVKILRIQLFAALHAFS